MLKTGPLVNHTFGLNWPNVGMNEELKGRNYVTAVVLDLEAAFGTAEKKEAELDINLL